MTLSKVSHFWRWRVCYWFCAGWVFWGNLTSIAGADKEVLFSSCYVESFYFSFATSLFFYGCFGNKMQNRNLRMDLCCIFSQGLVIGTKELDHTSKGNQFSLIVKCLFCRGSKISVHFLFSHFSYFFIICSLPWPFTGLHTGIGLNSESQ